MENIYKKLPKIIDFEQARISHKRRSEDACQHKHICIDPDNETVECTDCGKGISPFYALNMMMSYWANIDSKYRMRIEEANSIKEGKRLLKATQRVDKAWRSRKMLPTCPHCHRGISPDDGLGGSAVSKEYDSALRKRDRQQKIQS